MHYIRYDVLYAYVLARLQYWSMLTQNLKKGTVGIGRILAKESEDAFRCV